jgi:hypothetical protein
LLMLIDPVTSNAATCTPYPFVTDRVVCQVQQVFAGHAEARCGCPGPDHFGQHARADSIFDR